MMRRAVDLAAVVGAFLFILGSLAQPVASRAPATMEALP
jgi:hypothetical protein